MRRQIGLATIFLAMAVWSVSALATKGVVVYNQSQTHSVPTLWFVLKLTNLIQ